MDEIINALKWYISTDETNIGQAGNGFWEQGKLNAIKALIALDPELGEEYFDDIKELTESPNFWQEND
jgi:hypothetical protein